MSVAIVPVTIALLDVEEKGAEALASALMVGAPPEWPPEFNGPGYRRWQRSLLAADPDQSGFAGYYLIGDGQLVGTCGFKGPPDANGQVEVGYSVIAPRRRRGYASGAVALLVEKAFADPRTTAILGETLADGAASEGVLRRCGFEFVGTRTDDQDGKVMRFERRRPERRSADL